MLVEFNEWFEGTLDKKKRSTGTQYDPRSIKLRFKQCSTIVPKQKLPSFEKLDIYK